MLGKSDPSVGACDDGGVVTLYRETSTGTIWCDQELFVSLASEIEALDDDTLLKRENHMYGDAAILEYVIECCLVGIYDATMPSTSAP